MAFNNLFSEEVIFAVCFIVCLVLVTLLFVYMDRTT